MSSSPGAGYKLRPNKSVDRELFLSLLVRMAAPLEIESYKYVGLGGPFLEDFRLVHARAGIGEMTCVDDDEQTHLRQQFNRPVESVECIHSTLEEYIDATEFENPVVLWLDFTAPKKLQSQIELFTRQIVELPDQSVLRITLNANPSSLGTPKQDEIISSLEAEVSTGPRLPTQQEWRLKRFKERLPNFVPADLDAQGMLQANFGNTLLSILELAAESAVTTHPKRKVVWCFSTHYSDGQFMVTATVILADTRQQELRDLLECWEYRSMPTQPHVIDLPALSTLERLTMESYEEPASKLGFDLPATYMKRDPIETFKKFYRVYPHFSKVEI